MQIVERWILARLRHQTFFSLAALNDAIADLLIDLNQRSFKKLGGTHWFETIDQPALNQRTLGPLGADIGRPLANWSNNC